ncbi:MAG: 5'/3'-nucleotidase SurE, partial [Oligoflexia bacterium]|nr:5'/3'-nucleotidase SurE [Oligoflexia bacterium]
MRILITNDDGVGAPALQALVEVFAPWAEVWVVVPNEERSTSGHALTLRRPLYLRQMVVPEMDGKVRKFYSLDGLPADCTTMAIKYLMRDTPPSVVISGINRGGNLGQDI